MTERLKAPFPYFGGKSRIADLVWNYLGNVDNYIEPFCGSAAVLLARPHAPGVETLNDIDCMVANFWRATQHDPEAVAEHADHPVIEACLHAKHRWLVLSEDAATFRQRMRTEPDYYDAKIAGWWCWGLCCWIGAGWCLEPGVKGQCPPGGTGKRRPKSNKDGKGSGVNRPCPGGTTATQPKRPRAHRASGSGSGGTLPGVVGGPPQQVPGTIGDMDARGVNRQPLMPRDINNRPQLADAYSCGRGVHGNDEAGTCAQRRAWLLDWFGRLRDRLRTVRVCCGDWLRVCESESVTTRLGVTGLFLDPPYSAAAGRDPTLYASEDLEVAHAVRAYCLERGSNPSMRIVLCGYAGEGHEELEQHGWKVVAWKAQGGYGNRSAKGQENATKERLWVSPHCRIDQAEAPLFAGITEEP